MPVFSFSILHIIQILFVFISAFAVLLLWGQRRYRGARCFFVFQCTLSSMNLLEGLHITRDIYLLTPIFTLLLGPVCLFMVTSMVAPPATDEDTEQQSHYFWHWIPAFLALPFTHYTQTIIFCGSVSALYYVWLCFKKLDEYHALVEQVSSDVGGHQLYWLQMALLLFVVIVLCDFVRMNTQTFTPEPYKSLWYCAQELLFFIVSCQLLFYCIRQPKLFKGMDEYLKTLAQRRQKQTDTSLAEALFQQINTALVSEQLYKQPRLSLLDVSQHTGLNIRDVSWAINTVHKNSFCDFINGLRIQAVCNELKHTARKQSILSIALNAGFNSKSSFNVAFKKVMGITPTQFYKNYSIDL